MRKTAFIIILLFLFGQAGIKAQENLKVILRNDIDSLSYSLGLLIGNNLKAQGIKTIHPETYLKGVEDGFVSKPDNMTFEEANIFVQQYFEKNLKSVADANLKAGQAFLAENAKKDSVVTLNSGLQYKVLKPGNGPSPKNHDLVKVNYKGMLIDGTVFDSSYDRGQPSTFGVNQVIKGWSEALMLMRPGSHWMLYIPPELAYGDQGAGEDIGPNSVLIFDLQLLEVLGK